MLADELDSRLGELPAGTTRERLAVFGDLLWDTSPKVLEPILRNETAVLYSTPHRYIVLHRFPDGIRYYAAPAPVGMPFDGNDPDVWQVGIVRHVEAAAELVRAWLMGVRGTQIRVERAPAPWSVLERAGAGSRGKNLEVEEKIRELGGAEATSGSPTLEPFSEADLRLIESTLAIRLPRSYRHFLARYGGIAFREAVEAPTIADLPPSISSTRCVNFGFFYGRPTSGPRDPVALDWAIRAYNGRMPGTLIPIADDSGNVFCIGVSGDETGKVFYWDHENEADEEDYVLAGKPVPPDYMFQNVYLVAESFEDFIARLRRTE